MGYPISDIEGIGPTFKSKLKQAGIGRTDDLLRRGATPKGRRNVAEESGIDESKVLKWTNMADLMRIKGVAEEYSELLEAAGVDTVKELRRRRADNLAAAMAEVNAKRKLVRQVPGEKRVSSWIEQAKLLDPILEY